MKKKRLFRVIVLISIALMTTATSIATVSFLMHYAFNSIEKVYHKPSIMLPSYDVCVFGKERNHAFLKNGSRFYRRNNDGNFIKYDSFLNNEIIECVFNDDNYFFVSSHVVNNTSKHNIHVFDADLNLLSNIEISYKIEAMTLYDNELYCCASYYEKENDNIERHSLIKISMSTYEEELLSTNFYYNDVYFGENFTLFMQNFGASSKLQIVERGTFYSSYSRFYLYHHSYKNINFSIEKNLLRIRYLDNNYSIELPYKSSIFYDKVYMEGNHIIFAISEFIDNDKCIDSVSMKRCLCHYGRSSFFVFDLNSATFTDSSEYKTGCIFIDYNDKSILYYLDGNIYRDDSLIGNCKKMIIEGTVLVKGDDYYQCEKDYWLFEHRENNLELTKFLNTY